MNVETNSSCATELRNDGGEESYDVAGELHRSRPTPQSGMLRKAGRDAFIAQIAPSHLLSWMKKPSHISTQLLPKDKLRTSRLPAATCLQVARRSRALIHRAHEQPTRS